MPASKQEQHYARRYMDQRFGAYVIKLGPGECYVTADPEEMIVTVLGSCVSACVRDPAAGIGGMNHFMLPAPMAAKGEPVSAALRYGSFAMKQLIDDILTRGGMRRRLEVKLFGGGSILKGGAKIGWRNADFAETYIQREGLTVTAKHLRGAHARRILYFPMTGRVMLQDLADADEAVALEEQRYHRQLRAEPVESSMELSG